MSPNEVIVGSFKYHPNSKEQGSAAACVYKSGVFRKNEAEEQVAIKRIELLDILKNPNLAEINKRWKISHQYLLGYIHLEKDEGCFYIGLKPCATLLDYIYDDTFKADPLELLKQVTQGVDYLHSEDLAHTNLKPTNILCLKDGENYVIKLSDYCYEAYRTHAIIDTCTRKTECFTAPEVLERLKTQEFCQHISGKPSDIFSLGCIYYWTLTKGEHLYGDRYRSKSNIINKKPRFKTNFDTEKKPLIEAMIKQDPVERPKCDELLSDQFFSHAYSESLPDGIYYSNDDVLKNGSRGTVVYNGKFVTNRHERKCAVKVIPHKVVEASKVSEIKVLIDLEGHENIIRIFSSERKSEHTWIALEYCDYNLSEWFKDKSISKMLDPVEILREVTKGLCFLHLNKNIVHRDINPNNILIRRLHDGKARVKIADFGISRYMDTDPKTLTTPEGPSGWVAPETLRAREKGHTENLGFTTDIFNLGILAYYVFSGGEHPFGDNEIVQNENIKNGNLDVIKQSTNLDIRCNWPILQQMLANDKDKRPAATNVLHDPLLWDNPKKISFFEALYKLVDGVKFDAVYKETDKKQKHKCMTKLQNAYDTICGKDSNKGWFSAFQGADDNDKAMLPYLENPKGFYKDQKSSVIGLNRVIRDVYIHLEKERSNPRLQKLMELKSDPNKYMPYWLNKFPLLIYFTRREFQIFEKNEVMVSYYTEHFRCNLYDNENYAKTLK